MFNDLNKLIPQFVAAPIRAQEILDQAWADERAAWAAYRFANPPTELTRFFHEWPELMDTLAPRRQLLSEYEFECGLALTVRREAGFRLVAQPLNSAWEAVFGRRTPPPRLGFAHRARREETRETRLRLTVQQIPLPAGIPASTGMQDKTGLDHNSIDPCPAKSSRTLKASPTSSANSASTSRRRRKR